MHWQGVALRPKPCLGGQTGTELGERRCHLTVFALHCTPEVPHGDLPAYWCHGVLAMPCLCQEHPYIAAVLHLAAGATKNSTAFPAVLDAWEA